MAQYSWHTCPESIRIQLHLIVDELASLLADNLVGLYLHGSLAMGCFSPGRSDLDLLAVTRERMPLEAKRLLAESLLRLSKSPAPVEISFLSQTGLSPWRYPTPFDFHYSEDWREAYRRQLVDGSWRQWNDRVQEDPDLAAHITVLLNRGVRLFGKPIADTFPPAPHEDYLASILDDFEWGLERIAQNPVYFILNACRIYAYLRERKVFSKAEGGPAVLVILPEDLQGAVGQALKIYTGELRDAGFAPDLLQKFSDYMSGVIGWNYAGTWYHGSPLKLHTLRAGSTITQKALLARVFSHKPSLVSLSENDKSVRHTGTLPGLLYRIAKEIAPGDVYPHPRTSMTFGEEWLTLRDLSLECIGPTEVNPEERLTEAEAGVIIEALRGQG
ncbi:MAG: DUF4111 domain-containing protein [Armatimonadetes bacterium]|nr:DUF4111 domain-containing protein [Armatimonadota bacterium]